MSKPLLKNRYITLTISAQEVEALHLIRGKVAQTTGIIIPIAKVARTAFSLGLEQILKKQEPETQQIIPAIADPELPIL